MRKMRKEKTMKKIVSAVMALLMTIALFVPTCMLPAENHVHFVKSNIT